jgi:hypothetical protein
MEAPTHDALGGMYAPCLRPVRGEMFIVLVQQNTPSPFGGADTDLTDKSQPARPLLRTENGAWLAFRGYKHFTPHGVKSDALLHIPLYALLAQPLRLLAIYKCIATAKGVL